MLHWSKVVQLQMRNNFSTTGGNFLCSLAALDGQVNCRMKTSSSIFKQSFKLQYRNSFVKKRKKLQDFVSSNLCGSKCMC